MLGVVMIFGGLNASVIAQLDYDEWKTYVNPGLGISIDYPVMKFMHIFEHETLPSMLISGDFDVMIDALNVNDTVRDTKQMVELTTMTQINQLGKNILEDINPVVYANKTGYTVTTYKENPSRDSTLISKYVFLPHENKIYQFLLQDFNENYHEKTFDTMINSTKFFD
jgi:hypothetical protein